MIASLSVSKLLVTGSSSLVGSHFVEHCAKEYEISAIGRKNIFENAGILSSFEKIDLRNEFELKRAIEKSDAEFVVNFAAETNVDACETEQGNKKGNVYTVNTLAVLWIAQACRDTGKKLIQLSTDFVFDGTRGPYSEDDLTGSINCKISWYGITKYLAEVELLKTLSSNCCIVRISYPYRAHFDHKIDFARNILNLFRDGKLYPIFHDQIFTPTLIDDVSEALIFLIRRHSSGIFHIASANPTTPFEFASRLISTFFSIKEPEKVLKKSSIVEFNENSGRPPRPVKGGLRTERIYKEGFRPRTYQEGIEEIFRQLRTDYS